MAKFREGFVSNSSTTSFVVISAGGKELWKDGDEDCGDYEGFTINIDEMIKTLQEAKANGAEKVSVDHCGGYEG